MKRISRFLLLSTFLASCANAVTPAAPVATETSAPTATLVFTTTPKPIPTETPDPNAPLGYTKDANGNYTKTVMENGYTFKYVWDEENQTGLRKVNVAFPLFDFPAQNNLWGAKDQQITEIWLDERLEGEKSVVSISHPANSTEERINFLNIYQTQTELRLMEDGFKIVETPAQLMKGEFFIDFTTTEGDQRWLIGQNMETNKPTRIIIKILGDFDAHAPAVDPRFIEWKDVDPRETPSLFRSRVWTKQGNMHVEISPELSLKDLSQRQIVMMILWGPSHVINNSDETTVVNHTLYTLLDAEFDQAKQPFFQFDFSE